MSAVETPIWNKLKNETRHAYAAFKLYRDFPHADGPRSLDKAYRKFKRVPTDQSVSVSGRWQYWSKHYNWGARCDAFDVHQDQIEQAERDKATKRLVGQRADFEVARQAAKQKRILEVDAVLDKYQQEAAVSIRDLVQSKTTTEMVDGQPKTTVTVTRFKAIKGGDYGKVLKVQSELEAQAINGLREHESASDERSVVHAEPKSIIPEWLVQDLRAQAEVTVHIPVEKPQEHSGQLQ